MGFLNIWLTSFFNLDKYSLSITFLIVGGKSAENKGDPNFWQTNHPAAHGKVLAWWGNRKTKSKLCEIPHTCQSGHPQKDKKQVLARIERKGNFTVDGNVIWCSYHGKQYGGSTKIGTQTILWSSYSTSGYISKENENTDSGRYMHVHVRCSII